MNLLVSYPNSGRTWTTNMCKEIGIPLSVSHYNALGQISDIEQYTRQNNGSFFNNHKTIFLHRSTKDHVVSNYFQVTTRMGILKSSVSLAEFIRDKQYGVEKIIKYNILLNDTLSTRESIKIKYEDFHTNCLQTLQKICDFTNTQCDHLESIISNNSFENAHAREMIDPKIYTKVENPESFKARRGVVGGYVDYLSQEDIEYIDNLVAQYDYINRMNA